MTIEEIPLDVRPQVDVQNLLQLGQERDLTLEEIEDLYAQLFDVALEIEEESPLPPSPLEPSESGRYLYTDTVNADTDSQSERSWTIFEQVWEAQR